MRATHIQSSAVLIYATVYVKIHVTDRFVDANEAGVDYLNGFGTELRYPFAGRIVSRISKSNWVKTWKIAKNISFF